MPECPSQVEHVWLWFWEITRRRAPAFDGAAPLTHTEVEAWSRLTRTVIRPWEVKMLFRIDDGYLEQRAKEIEGQRDRQKEKQ
jgi:hypothetical protein